MTVKELINLLEQVEDKDIDVNICENGESLDIYAVDYDEWGGITISPDYTS